VATLVYAEFAEVRLASEKPIPDDAEPRITELIKRASARLTAMRPWGPTIPYRLSAGTLDPEIPAGLVIDAVLRVYRNPTGVTQRNVGPFGQQFNAKATKAEISFDSDEVDAALGIPDAVPGTFRVGIPRSQRPAGGLWGPYGYPDLPPVI
jgi:hypothetical protein